MLKELIISIIIVILIFVGNTVTQGFTNEAVQEATNLLNEIREEIIKEEDEIDFEFAKQKVDEIHEKWDVRYEKLAYYIEHNELEKVETELTALKAYIDKKEDNEVLAEIDKSVYILEHIKQKSSFDLKNIF